MTKRMLSICLAFVLLLGTLAGCSKNKTKTDNSSQNTQQETIPELASQYAYQPQYFDLPEPIQWISRSCVSGSTLYFTMKARKMQEAEKTESGVPSAHRFLRIKNTIFFSTHHAKPHLEK